MRTPSYTIYSLSAVRNPRSAIDIRNRPRIPIPDEDPYSIAGSGSSGGSSGNGNGPLHGRERSRDKPPKLPPRENIYGTAGHPKAWTPAAARQAQVRYPRTLSNFTRHSKRIPRYRVGCSSAEDETLAPF